MNGKCYLWEFEGGNYDFWGIKVESSITKCIKEARYCNNRFAIDSLKVILIKECRRRPLSMHDKFSSEHVGIWSFPSCKVKRYSLRTGRLLK